MTSRAEAETLLEFPCEFPVKVFGKDSAEFERVVFEAISTHVPGLQPDAVTRHASSKGNYVALTVTFTATSKLQLDSIYRELTSQPLVLMAL